MSSVSDARVRTAAATASAERAPAQEISELSAAEKERGMHYVLWGAALGVVYFFAVDSSVFTLFLTRLGASNTQIGWVLSLLQVMAVVQVFMAGIMERYGKKRFLVSGWAIATVLTVAFVAVPWVAERYSPETAIYVLILAIIPISLARQVGNAPWMPMINDVTPEDVRGRFFGKMRTIWQVVSIAFLLFTVFFFMGQASPAFWRYQVVFAIGIAASVWRVFVIARIPELPPSRHAEKSLWRTINMPFRDRVYLRFTLFTVVLTAALAVTDAYTVVYLKKGMGYNDAHALFASTTVSYIGSVLSLLFWGMLADRVGSKPLLIITTLAIGLVRLLWLGAEVKTFGPIMVQSIFLLNGIFSAGYGIANTTYLFSICPPRVGRTIYVVAAGVITTLVSSGMVSLGGYIIDGLEGYHSELHAYGLDEYRLPFLMTGLMTVLSTVLLFRLRERGTVPTREVLAALVSRPIRTSYNVFLFSRMLPEERRIDVTRALGDTGSVIGEEELIKALDDPSFQVRREAVDALAKMKCSRAVKPLMAKLADPGSFVRVPAATALGEIGSAAAVGSLDVALADSNPELRLEAALALGKIGAPEAIGRLREALPGETDATVWSVMATSLATLGDRSIVADIIERLDDGVHDAVSGQLMIAASNAIGAENEFYQYLHAGEGRFAESARDIAGRIRDVLQGLPHAGFRGAFDVDIDFDGAIDAKDYAKVTRDAHELACAFHPEGRLPKGSPSCLALRLMAGKKGPHRWEGALLALVCLEAVALGVMSGERRK